MHEKIVSVNNIFMNLFIILILAALFAAVIAFFVTKKRNTVVELKMVDLSEKEAIDICLEKAKELRSARSDSGVKISVFYNKIKKAERLIRKKINNKEDVSEAEKWLYENYRYAYNAIFQYGNTLRDLPSVGGVPRIVLLARSIVSNSLNDLTPERVKKIMDKINRVLPLGYRELIEFRHAFRYAIIEQIYVLADRILNDAVFKREANKNKFQKKLLNSDTYLYYTIQKDRFTKERLKEGVDEKSILLSYGENQMKNMLMAKTLFPALVRCDELFPPEEGVKNLKTYAILDKKFSLETNSAETVLSYFKIVHEVAKKCRVSEAFVGKTIILCSEKNKMDISTVLLDHYADLIRSVKTGTYVFKRRKDNKKETIYIGLSFTVASAISVFVYFLFRSVFLSVISFLPVLYVTDKVTLIFFSLFGRKYVCPKLKLDSIPKEHSTSVVISSYCTSLDDFIKVRFHAESIISMNREEHVNCVLLVDTPASDEAISGVDKEIREYFSRQDNIKIVLFLRKKVYNGKQFVAQERKRGAIMSLCKYFVRKDDSDFYYISDKNMEYPNYIVSLDTDNNLLPGGVKDMVEHIAHPYNNKFNIISTTNRVDLFSLKTLFSRRYLFDAGFEGYPYFTGMNYSIFGKDHFCGKGIFRVKEFYNILAGLFPKGKILSHDIPEGAIVGCGSGGTTFEDVPNTFLSERSRAKRWMRGDIQNMPFIIGRWKSSDGSKVQMKLSPLYRWGMLKNILFLFVQMNIVSTLFFGLLIDPTAIIFALTLYFFPSFVDFLRAPRMMTEKKSLRNIFKRVAAIARESFEGFIMLIYTMTFNGIVFITTVLRMVFNKDLLQWKTFSQSNSVKGACNYAKEYIPTLVASVLLISVLLLVGKYTAVFYFGAYVFCAILTYIMLLLLSTTPLSDKIATGTFIKNKLIDYARATYNYFSYMNNDTIIADNLQVNPYKGTCAYTSATDIGFSVLAEICAVKLGLISLRCGTENVKKILKNVSLLPKWRGNLYNWYFVGSMKQTNGFVSSVDEGNFLIGLYIAKSFFKGIDEEIVRYSEMLIDKTDLLALYDNNKKMFFIGVEEDKPTGHYDMLCSEARILSFVYVMKYGKIDNYIALSRDYTSLGENTLLSWGGSAFEVLLPELFINTPYDSLLNKTAYVMSVIQSENNKKKIWGVSESGYARFDSDLHYQYKCFGLSQLSVSTDTEEEVFSPYSSFLCLEVSEVKTIENLQKMEKVGLYGEFGFYESIDMTNSGKIVYQYMTHHQGMILCAITNKLYNGFLKETISSLPEGYGARVLMNERSSSMRFKKQNKIRYKKKGHNKVGYNVICNNVALEPVSVGLTDGNFRLIVNANGGNFSSFDRFFLQAKKEEYSEAGGAFFYVKKGDGYVSPTFLPLCDGNGEYCFSFDGQEARYVCEKDKLGESVGILPGLNGCYYKLDCAGGDKVFFYSDICMNTHEAYQAHPTFSDMFVRSDLISDDTVLFTRRGKEERYVVVRVTGANNISFGTNRLYVLGRAHDLSDPLFDFKTECAFGDVLHPCFSFSADVFESGFCCVTFLTGMNKNDLLSLAGNLPIDVQLLSKQSANPYLLQQKTIENLSNILYGVCYDNNGRIVLSDKKEIVCQVEKKEDIDLYVDLYENMLMMREPVGLVIPKSPLSEIFVKACEARRMVYRSCEKIDFERKCKVADNDYHVLKFDESDEEIPLPTLYFRTGSGGFDAQGNYICFDENAPKLVYSHVIAGERGGSLMTTNGGGFYWFGNSRENKVVRFDNDPVSERKGELLSLVIDGKKYSLLGGTGKGRYSEIAKGYFTHNLKVSGMMIKTTVTSIFDGRARVIEIDVSDRYEKEFVIDYSFYPCLSSVYEKGNCSFGLDGHVLKVKNEKSGNEVFLTFVGKRDRSFIDKGSSLPNISIKSDRSEKFLLVISPDKDLICSLTEESVKLYAEAFIRKCEDYSCVDVVCGRKGLENILPFLPYQIVTSRIFARAGFYQVGGAFGFRDQLQDSMALFFRPDLLRKQILISCAHQYEEGDVMHWWHPPKMGLRTRITDDKLFLPMSVCRYLSLTGDMKFLDEGVEFLRSPILEPSENSRYEDPQFGESGTVFQHCLKAIRSSLKYGEHRLLIMGSGDWNDGMDEVCRFGKGESVFNSMLAYYVLSEFSQYCEEELKKELLSIAVDLKNAVNTFAFDGDRYLRLFSDEGRWLGGKDDKTLRLDLLVQAVAVLSGVADGERARIVLDTGKKLIDKEAGIIKLLDPPQSNEERLGYISDYPPGVRENGGQYTHAAVWYLMALCKADRQDEAFDLFCMINPAEKCSTKEGAERYKGEPYVFAGDVYSNKDNYGRCGWSWYTGSAAWAFRLISEYFFGLKTKGNKLYIEPKLPKKLDGCTVTYRYKNSVYLIEYRFGLRDKTIVDGVESDHIELKEGYNCSVLVEIGL